MAECFDICLDEIKRLEVFVEMCWSGLDFASNASRVIEVLEKQFIAAGRDMEQEYDRAKRLETFAEEQKKVGFSYVYNLASIRLWGIIEAFIDDFMLYVIMNDKDVKNREVFKKLKGPLIEFSLLSEQEQAEYLLYLLKHELRTEFKLGVEKFEVLLQAVDFDGYVDKHVRKNLLELSQIRNVLVHRNGKADARLLRNCPWLKYAVGENIHLNHYDLGRYIMSVHWYVLEISKRGIGRFEVEGAATAEQHEEVQALLVERLEEAERAELPDGNDVAYNDAV